MSLLRRLANLRKVSQSIRRYASIANSGPPAVLHLKTGQSFQGKAFGAPVSVFGETVFSTSITSCMTVFLLAVFVFLLIVVDAVHRH
jgi:carbamoyl-phosphate synthase small subunit